MPNDTSAGNDMPRANGYRGIWYANQKTDSPYVYKYSGGLGTYCAKHIPQAIYAPEVNKTFFVYGGTSEGERNLLEMASYYDHETGLVPRPTIVLDKKTQDAHDNPVMAIDKGGHIFVFASAHGTARPAYIFKSKKPYDVSDFDQLADWNYSYPQPWYFPDRGFLFLHTRYGGGRRLFMSTSADGKDWSEGRMLAHIDEGHYQISWPNGDKAGTAFNYHPAGKGLNFRTNIYYMESDDMGATWRTITGEPVETPVQDIQNNALAQDYEKEGLLAYMKDINYDKDGNPVILHVIARGWEPGPEGGLREFRVLHWRNGQWQNLAVAEADNNYDMGSLFVDPDGTWRVIAPLSPGPQPFNPGGEIAVLESPDEAGHWKEARFITRNSEFNHTYVRRVVNGHPDFTAYWADGHGRQPSDSRIYFCDAKGTTVRRLPFTMDKDFAEPEVVA